MRARDGLGPLIPCYLVCCTERPRNFAEFVFAGNAPPPDRAARRTGKCKTRLTG
jgi:hypothetical protein